ncbi:MAG: hypothetical protein ACKVOW_05735 [Chitinophagaceae bacterium]
MKSILLFISSLLIVNSATEAQQTLPAVIVKRMQVADADISNTQSFYYKRKEEFHQVLVADLGERSGKKAPVAFYVDFLAMREKVNPNYTVEIRWLQMEFYNARTEMRSVPIPQVKSQRDVNGQMSNVQQVQNEYRFIYPVKAVLEILIYQESENGKKLVLEKNEPVDYDFTTLAKNTQSTKVWVKPPQPSSPDKPLIFKELNLAYYEFIKKTILAFFNRN